MNLDDNTTKIILYILGIIVAIIGASFIAIKISKKRSNNVRQENIIVKGSGKVIGGDDKSINK